MTGRMAPSPHTHNPGTTPGTCLTPRTEAIQAPRQDHALQLRGHGSGGWSSLLPKTGPTAQSVRLDGLAVADIDIQVKQVTMKLERSLKTSSCIDWNERRFGCWILRRCLPLRIRTQHGLTSCGGECDSRPLDPLPCESFS